MSIGHRWRGGLLLGRGFGFVCGLVGINMGWGLRVGGARVFFLSRARWWFSLCGPTSPFLLLHCMWDLLTLRWGYHIVGTRGDMKNIFVVNIISKIKGTKKVRYALYFVIPIVVEILLLQLKSNKETFQVTATVNSCCSLPNTRDENELVHCLIFSPFIFTILN